MFDVRDFGARGDGDTDDTQAFTEAVGIAQGVHGTLLVPAGTYAVSSLPNMAGTDNWSLIGVGGMPIIKHTGSGIAFDLDGSVGTSDRTWNVRVENIAVQGNGATTHGFRFKSLHHSVFRNLRVLSTSSTGVGFRTEWTVANLYEMLVCTSNENNGASTLPSVAIEVDRHSTEAGRHSEDNTFLNCIIEGLDANGNVGLHLIDGNRNWFIGGTIESNYKHIEIESICVGNTFIGMYSELASSGIAMTVRGQWTQFQNCFVQSAGVGGRLA